MKKKSLENIEKIINKVPVNVDALYEERKSISAKDLKPLIKEKPVLKKTDPVNDIEPLRARLEFTARYLPDDRFPAIPKKDEDVLELYYKQGLTNEIQCYIDVYKVSRNAARLRVKKLLNKPSSKAWLLCRGEKDRFTTIHEPIADRTLLNIILGIGEYSLSRTCDVLKAIDMLYKRLGSYSPEKHQNINFTTFLTKEQLIEQVKSKLEALKLIDMDLEQNKPNE